MVIKVKEISGTNVIKSLLFILAQPNTVSILFVLGFVDCLSAQSALVLWDNLVFKLLLLPQMLKISKGQGFINRDIGFLINVLISLFAYGRSLSMYLINTY